MDLILIGGGTLLFLLFIISHFFSRLHLPTLLSYILLGLILSRFIGESETDVIHDIAQIGIVLLFFLLGLKFSLNHLMNISRRIWKVGILDIIFNFGISFGIAYFMGFGLIEALIIGGVCYATSSSITIKALEETDREHTPEAEFKLALLIFEDIAAPVMVSVLTALTVQGQVQLDSILIILIKAILMTVVSILVARYFFSRLEVFIKRYLETDYMPLLIMSIVFLVSGIAVVLDLSKLLGAFLAGVMLSETLTGKELEEKISPLKNILLPFFFFWFGTSISFEAGLILPFTLFVLVLWSIVSKFFIGLAGGRMYGLSRKGSLRAGLSLTQRGEFSVIIASLAEPAVLTFSGVYIIITALIGLLFMFRAPGLSEKIHKFVNNRKLI
ncbi:cation:proton antiporter [Natranaerobius trueperi]|uniref:Sodium:proton exchanger n=1 Tax=Natranaerobius trueperi TaxID=759412 RepID=A0A226BZ86_9FIRM|nr:cation:proton antiporter [Natranaerobius trueperi]OWZ84358.1 sodium:proton exchanger [Natranaerobius trueperi]